jgi:DNA invertase Pin-like site-specific DNA recombinase
MNTPRHPNAPLRALSWIAVSSGKQAKDDKISLPEQQRLNRAVADENGWEIIDELRVPGHSRAYIDIHTCASDMRAQGIDAFDKLLAHWKARDFDVLICYASDRFARTQSLLAYVVEMTIIECGAVIHSIADGLITRQNMRMFVSMTGYKAASDMDRLREFAAKDRRKRAEAGKAVSSKVPMSHRIVRDPVSGKDTGVALREEFMPLWIDVAELLLAGVGYINITRELFRRGHARPDGKPYRPGLIHETMRSPTFWGCSALNFRPPGGRYVGDASWLWDETVPLPPGVTLLRDKLPAVYTGELAARIKAELLRRQTIRGRANPENTYIWTGLVRCGICGYRMAVAVKPVAKQPLRGVRCEHVFTRTETDVQCPNRGLVTDASIRNFLTRKLTDWLAGKQVLPTEEQPADVELGAWAEKEAASVQARIERLILEQSSAPDSAQPIYRKQIAQLSEQLTALRTRAAEYDVIARSRTADDARRVDALQQIREIGPADLWAKPSREVNQLLHTLLHGYSMVGYNRRIVGFQRQDLLKPDV